MRISVIIPVYNGERLIRQTLTSVLTQPYKNIEIICVDDGSADKSAEIIKSVAKSDNRVKYIHKDNGGVHSARNIGISIANGDYIVFLDQDDLWIKDSINVSFVKKIQSNKCDFYKCSFGEISYNLKRCKFFNMPDSQISDIKNEKLQHHSSYIFDANFLKNYDITSDKYRCEDWRFLLKCYAYAKKARHISTPFFMYRNNPTSVTHSSNSIAATKSSLDGYFWQLNNTNNMFLKNSCGIYSIRYSIELIKNVTISNNAEEEIHSIINHYDLPCLINNFWSSDKDKDEYKKIVNNTSLYIKNCRRITKRSKILNFARKSRFVRYLYSIKKYPQKAKGFV